MNAARFFKELINGLVKWCHEMKFTKESWELYLVDAAHCTPGPDYWPAMPYQVNKQTSIWSLSILLLICSLLVRDGQVLIRTLMLDKNKDNDGNRCSCHPCDDAMMTRASCDKSVLLHLATGSSLWMIEILLVINKFRLGSLCCALYRLWVSLFEVSS